MKKNIGFNYLHSHPMTEQSLGLSESHVIVDRSEWREVVEYFHRHPEAVEELGRSMPLDRQLELFTLRQQIYGEEKKS